MDWLILILGVPAILIPLVLLFGFAGCVPAVVCADDRDCPNGTICVDGACLTPGDPLFPLSPPENLVARAIDDRSVLLTWTDNDPAGTDFQIERAEDGDDPLPITPSGVISAAGTTDDSGLQEGVTYIYQVRAQGDGVPDSDFSEISSATVLPATPAQFTATAAGITRINLSWINASTVATEFSLDRRALPGGAIIPIILPDPTSTRFFDSERTGLVDGTTYEYRVFATVNGVENSAGQLVNSLPAVQTATTPTPTVAFAAPPGTLTSDQASREGVCLVQKLRRTLLTAGGTQLRILLRGSSLGSLTLDRITISQPAATGDPYDAGPDLTDVGSSVTIPRNTVRPVGPVNYTLDPTTDLLVAFDISNTANEGNLCLGTLLGADQFGRVGTAEAGVQDRTSGYVGPFTDTLFLIEKIEVL
jgi:hypothetical protein